MRKHKIIIIEDDKGLQYLIRKKLSSLDVEIFSAESGKSFFNIIESDQGPFLLLLDYKLPDISAKEILNRLTNLSKEHPYIIMTGYGDERIAVDVMKMGALDYLVKDSNFMDLLLPVVNQALKHIETQAMLSEELERSKEKDVILYLQSKQAAMGEMISHIAHQWRQPLNAISLVLQNIHDAHQYNELDDKKIQEYINKANHLINYMSGTIDDFKNFINPSKKMARFEVSQIVDKAIEMIQPYLEAFHVNIEFEKLNTISINGYKNEYLQVILNILNNSKDFLVERQIENPEIKIKLNHEGSKSILEIYDNAKGISEKIIDKVFDPYFTTKEDINGSGLGLYMAKKIITESMNGKISVMNTKEGVKFTIIV